MDPKRYLELYNSDLVIKCNTELDFQGSSFDGSIAVGVYFNSDGLIDSAGSKLDKRVLLTVYPCRNNDNLICVPDTNSIVFLVLAEDKSRAYSYRLLIDVLKQSATIAVMDMPDRTNAKISQAEREGITKSILPSHQGILKS